MNPVPATALTILAAFAASAAATWLVRGWLERRRVLDAPGSRSLHENPTVTGGGMAVAVVTAAVWLLLQPLEAAPPAAILIPLVILTAVGLVDDLRNMAWLHKLLAQLAVAIMFIAAAGPFSRL